jgi:steroid 5-alpha reductase family enzyme
MCARALFGSVALAHAPPPVRPGPLSSLGRGASFALVGFVYLTAIGAGLGAGLQWDDPYLALAAGFVASTLAVFAWSLGTRNSSCFDAWWSVAPGLAVWLLPFENGPRTWIVRALVTAWALRLTWNWARGWAGMRHEDWRYVDLREKTGAAYWAVSFLGIHLFPAVLVTLGSMAMIPALASTAPLGSLDLVAMTIGALAVVVEATADQQLVDFVRSKPARGSVLQHGLWAWSRHPNYLGEIGFWWSLAGFALASGGPEWTFAGAAAITALFAFVSIPMMEKRHAARRPSYVEYQRRVPMLVPWRVPKRERSTR